MKVFLLDLAGELWKTSFATGQNKFDPLHIGYLGAYLKSKNIDVEIFQQRQETEQEIIDKVCSEDINILAISAMTCDFDLCREIARKIKERKNIITIFGGYHVTGDKNSLNYPEIDFIVIGEGEETLFELVKEIKKGSKADFKRVKGIGFKENGKLVFTQERERILDLDSLPLPLRYKIEECKMGLPMFPIPEKQISFAQICYSRGCVHNCLFCTSPKMWKRKIVYRSAKNVVDEVEYLIKEFGTNSLWFTDLTFNAHDNKAVEICNEIIKRKLNITWAVGCRITDNESLLRLMRQAGCVRIGYGAESLDNDILKYIRKGQTFSDIKKCFEITNNVGIISRAYLMIGYPNETKEDIERMAERVKELPADQIRISFITPFPGTEIYEEMKKKGMITTEDRSKYTTEFPVIKTKIPPEELLSLRKEIFRAFYSNPEYIKRIKQKAEKFPDLKEGYKEFLVEVNRNLGLSLSL